MSESLEKDLKATTMKMLLQASILLKQMKKVENLSKEIEAIIKNEMKIVKLKIWVKPKLKSCWMGLLGDERVGQWTLRQINRIYTI